MNDAEPAVADDKPLAPLQLFIVKVATVTVAILIVLYAASVFIDSLIESRQEQLLILKGGPTFWGTVERKFYTLADEPDLPPEKKAKIVDALRKLSSKYKPYLDALGGDGGSRSR